MENLIILVKILEIQKRKQILLYFYRQHNINNAANKLWEIYDDFIREKINENLEDNKDCTYWKIIGEVYLVFIEALERFHENELFFNNLEIFLEKKIKKTINEFSKQEVY
jgi:hypothetical protein